MCGKSRVGGVEDSLFSDTRTRSALLQKVEHHHKVGSGAGEDEEMPQIMEPEHIGPETGALQGEYDTADGIDDATG